MLFRGVTVLSIRDIHLYRIFSKYNVSKWFRKWRCQQFEDHLIQVCFLKINLTIYLPPRRRWIVLYKIVSSTETNLGLSWIFFFFCLQFVIHVPELVKRKSQLIAWKESGLIWLLRTVFRMSDPILKIDALMPLALSESCQPWWGLLSPRVVSNLLSQGWWLEWLVNGASSAPAIGVTDDPPPRSLQTRGTCDMPLGNSVEGLSVSMCARTYAYGHTHTHARTWDIWTHWGQQAVTNARLHKSLVCCVRRPVAGPCRPPYHFHRQETGR